MKQLFLSRLHFGWWCVASASDGGTPSAAATSRRATAIESTEGGWRSGRCGDLELEPSVAEVEHRDEHLDRVVARRELLAVRHRHILLLGGDDKNLVSRSLVLVVRAVAEVSGG